MIGGPEKPHAALVSPRGPLRSCEDRPLLATAGPCAHHSSEERWRQGMPRVAGRSRHIAVDVWGEAALRCAHPAYAENGRNTAITLPAMRTCCSGRRWIKGYPC